MITMNQTHDKKFHCTYLLHSYPFDTQVTGRTREVLMGVGDGVASVIMLTFAKRHGPHADFYKEARPPC